MTKVDAFYSINEGKKPVEDRVYHDNDKCGPGSEILHNDRLPGEGNKYRHCDDCTKETNLGH
jgi:hypothetical protein